MARPKNETPVEVVVPNPLENIVDTLKVEIELLKERLDEFEIKLNAKKPATKSIHKVEQFNNEVIPDIRPESNIRMGYDDMVNSMINACKILPPNLISEGRHTQENIQAICGFMVTDEMMDEAYSRFSHGE
jgi:hypothetical protein